MMKKILVITIYDITKSWWLSTYVKNLNNLYLSNGIQSEIITPYENINFLDKSMIFFTKIIYILNNNIGLNFYYLILASVIRKKIMNTHTEDVIFHFQDVVSLYYIHNNSLFNSKNVLTLHWDITNMNLSDRIINYNSKGYFYSLYIERSWYENADKIIAVDERLKNHVIWFWIDENKIKNFPNFTDISKFLPVSNIEKENLRKKYEISENKKVIFCPRRLVEKNGVIYTVDIIEKLTKDFLLIITWEWSEKNNVLNRMSLLNVSEKIILTWDISNDVIKDYYNLSDVVIIPSINSNWVIEATSISAIESMACWVPVVASNIWWLAELITNWYNWYLCEEKNVEDFVKKIEHYFNLTNTDKELIINNAISSVKEKFSFESYFQKLKDFIF